MIGKVQSTLHFYNTNNNQQPKFQPKVQANIPNDSFTKTSNPITKKDYIIGAAGLATVVGGTIASICIFKKSPAVKAKNAVKLLKKEMSKYPKDVQYRKNILQDMNLNTEDYHKLRPIVGVQELKSLVKDFDKAPNSYTPGIKSYEIGTGEVKFRGKEFVNDFQ